VIGEFEPGSSILLSGPAGSGKTIFIIDHLKHVLDGGVHCIYVVVEKGYNRTGKEALHLSLDISKYIGGSMVFIDYLPQTKKPFNNEILVSGSLTDLMIEIEKHDREPQVIVLDSLTPLTFYNDPNVVMKALLALNKRVERRNSVVMVSVIPMALDTRLYNAIEGLFDYVLRFKVDAQCRRLLRVTKSIGAALLPIPIVIDISDSQVTYKALGEHSRYVRRLGSRHARRLS